MGSCTDRDCACDDCASCDGCGGTCGAAERDAATTAWPIQAVAWRDMSLNARPAPSGGFWRAAMMFDAALEASSEARVPGLLPALDLLTKMEGNA